MQIFRSNDGVKSTTKWVNLNHYKIISECFSEHFFGFGDAQLAGEELGEEGVAELGQAFNFFRKQQNFTVDGRVVISNPRWRVI